VVRLDVSKRNYLAEEHDMKAQKLYYLFGVICIFGAFLAEIVI